MIFCDCSNDSVVNCDSVISRMMNMRDEGNENGDFSFLEFGSDLQNLIL